jgi:hypothetical protein
MEIMTLRKRTVSEEHSMARFSVHEYLKQHGPSTFRELGSTGLCEIRLKRALVELEVRKVIQRQGRRYVVVPPAGSAG